MHFLLSITFLILAYTISASPVHLKTRSDLRDGLSIAKRAPCKQVRTGEKIWRAVTGQPAFQYYDCPPLQHTPLGAPPPYGVPNGYRPPQRVPCKTLRMAAKIWNAIRGPSPQAYCPMPPYTPPPPYSRPPARFKIGDINEEGLMYLPDKTWGPKPEWGTHIAGIVYCPDGKWRHEPENPYSIDKQGYCIEGPVQCMDIGWEVERILPNRPIKAPTVTSQTPAGDTPANEANSFDGHSCPHCGHKRSPNDT